MQHALAGQPGAHIGLGGIDGPLFAATAGTAQQRHTRLGHAQFAGEPFAQRLVGGAIDGWGGQAHTQGTVMPAHQFGAFGIGRDAQVQDDLGLRAFAFQAQAGPGWVGWIPALPK